MSPTALTTLLPFIMRHRAPGVCNGGLLTTDDDHFTSVLFLPGCGPTRPVSKLGTTGFWFHHTSLHCTLTICTVSLFMKNKVYLVMSSTPIVATFAIFLLLVAEVNESYGVQLSGRKVQVAKQPN